MKTIELTRNYQAIVDDEDYEAIAAHEWFAMLTGRNRQCVYAGRYLPGTRTLVLMHRVVSGAEKGQIVDHIDRNSLNNVRANLRLGTQQNNCWNRPPQKNKKHSQYKGVTLDKWGWLVQCQGKRVGSFKTEIEAARAYNERAKELFGEYAYQNVID